MKKAFHLLLLASVTLVSLGSRADGLTSLYWPMNHGDHLEHTGQVSGQALAIDLDYTSYWFNGYYGFRLYQDGDGGSASLYFDYSAGGDEVLLLGGSGSGISFTFDPPVIFLDESLLQNGGSRTTATTIYASGTDLPAKVTISIGQPGTLTVPAGTYRNCRSLKLSIAATVPDQGNQSIGAYAFDLSPRVGMVRSGVYSYNGSSFQLLGYLGLTSGTVGGTDVRLLSDSTPPTVTVTTPAANSRMSNAVVTATGKASDDVRVTNVVFQLNSGAWQPATTANGWTNWTATLNLVPGTNTLKTYAVDAIGNRSTTNSVKFVYVLSAPLTLGITGKGTLSPNYSNALLEVGKLHTITATAAAGYAFTNWTEGGGLMVTNHRSLRFVMASNLTFLANFVDTNRPSLTLSTPTASQRWSNTLFTAHGRASDNLAVAFVQYQLNGGDWFPAATTNNWTNWTAILNLTPGTNTLRTFAADVTGNRSTTNSVNFVYVLTAPLTLSLTGKGSLSPNYSNALLEVGKLHTITATPTAGFAFTNWTDGNSVVVTNHRSLRFLMTSNLAFTANFVDTNRPTVAISAPTAEQRWSNAVLTVLGKAGDNLGVTSVFWQTNDGPWMLAATTNGWTNWTTALTLSQRTNTLRAYAVDERGNRSTTNSVRFIYVFSAPLTLSISGKGTLSPNYSNAVLELGKLHAISATAAAGYAFTNWTDGDGLIVTNNRTLQFLMASNLVFRANFVDTNRPVLTVTAPTANQRWSNAVFTARGTAKDNLGMASVLYQLNDDVWSAASTTNSWTNWMAVLNLTPGTNTLKTYALDVTGNRSPTNTARFVYVLPAPLTLGLTGKGTLSPNYSNALLELGKLHTITATAATGFAFTNWTDGSGLIVTNHRALRFLMASNLTFIANFMDTNRPVITVTSPVSGTKVTNTTVTARGTATDNVLVSEVFASLNDGPWLLASGTTQWSLDLDLPPGTNRLSVYAVDSAGNRSTTNRITCTVPSYQGIYTGKFAGQSDSGGFAVLIHSNQTGVVLGYNTPQEEGVSASGFVIAPNGGFTLTTDLGGTVRGTFTATSVSGTFTNSSGQPGSFSGTRRPDSGIQKTNAGLYQGTYSGTSTGAAWAILAADGTLFFRTSDGTPDGDAGGFGTVNTQNIIGGTIVPDGFTISGTLNTATGTLSGIYKSGALTLGTFVLTRDPGSPASPIVASVATVTSATTKGKETSMPPLPSRPVVNAVSALPIAPPLLNTPELLPDGFGFSFAVEPGHTYRVQATADLMNWQELTNFVSATSGTHRFVETSTTGHAQRYYRVVSP